MIKIEGRQCNGCTACCRIIPVKEIDKPANTRCKHQGFKGCRIYANRPFSCRVWSCAWLTGIDTENMSRPDRAGYVIDPMPDYVTARPDDGGPDVHFGVIQVWLDPKRPDAHKDPALRAFLLRRGEEGFMAIIRRSSTDAFLLSPPNTNTEHRWVEKESGMTPIEHTADQIARVIQGMRL